MLNVAKNALLTPATAPDTEDETTMNTDSDSKEQAGGTTRLQVTVRGRASDFSAAHSPENRGIPSCYKQGHGVVQWRRHRRGRQRRMKRTCFRNERRIGRAQEAVVALDGFQLGSVWMQKAEQGALFW